MGDSSKPSSSIVAAGIVAILGGLILAAFSVTMLFAMSTVKIAEVEPSLPGFFKNLFEIIWIFLLVSAACVFISGVGVVRLRNWARISLMVVAGLMLFFGLTGVILALFAVLGINVPGPPEAKSTIMLFLALIYGAPVIVALWWLILFTRRSVVAQFELQRGTLPPARTIRFSKPGCPLPVSVVAWFVLSTLPGPLLIPFLPFRIPVVLFGHVFKGSAAAVALTVLTALLGISSIGLLRLQRWSFPVGVVLQLFRLASSLVSLADPRYAEKMRAVLGEMHLPAPPPGVPDFMQYARYFGLFGLLIPLACVVCLLYSRDAFLFAAETSAVPGRQPSRT